MSRSSDRDLGIELGFRSENFRQGEDFVVDSDECGWIFGDYDDDFALGAPPCWESLQLDDHHGLGYLSDDVNIQLEEIDSCIDEVEVLSMFPDDDDDPHSFDVDNVGRDGDADAVDVVDLEVLGNMEWEVLLSGDELDFNPGTILDDETAGLSIFADDDDYLYADEYEPLFGQSNDVSLSRRPASRFAMEQLPTMMVDLTEDEDRNCAICKDPFKAGEEAVKMPCDHVYHTACIQTWLRIRNTCPVCRYELPTDDTD